MYPMNDSLECPVCDGVGELRYDASTYHGGYDEKVVKCPTCGGKKYITWEEAEEAMESGAKN